MPSRTNTLRTAPGTVALTTARVSGISVPDTLLVRTKDCMPTLAMSLGVNSNVTGGSFFLAASAERAEEFLETRKAAVPPTTSSEINAIQTSLRRAGVF